MPRQEKDGGGELIRSSKYQIPIALGILGFLAVAIVTSYSGPMGFLKAVSEERNLGSIALLMCFIGVLIVLTHSMGLGIGREEIETVNST